MAAFKKSPPAEFIALTDKYLAGEITADELRRWEALCATEPEALDYYLTVARTEGLVPEALARLEKAGARGRVIVFYRRPAFLAGAAAALALGVFGVVVSGILTKPSGVSANYAQSSGVPATITNSIGVRWTEGSGEPGSRLGRASGAFSAGLLELTLDSGVRLLVQGPAAYDITGPNSVRLASGRAVADVPLNARGFTLESPRERIVDHGTRFAVDVAQDASGTTLGVLSGEVQLFHGDKDVRLYTDYAVRNSADGVTSVPFRKENFITETPGREFPWSLDGAKHDAVRTLTFDVTRLVYGPGDYRAVVRWLLGSDAISVKSFRLERDGVVVATAGGARSGDIERTVDNAPVLRVTDAGYAPGKWKLVVEALAEGVTVVKSRPVSSQGVVSFEEGLSLTADAVRFAGRWAYSHNGSDFVREFLPDGRARLYINGVLFTKQGFNDAHYTVRDGVLTLDLGAERAAETHMLRDDRTLIFINRPYRAARRE